MIGDVLAFTFLALPFAALAAVLSLPDRADRRRRRAWQRERLDLNPAFKQRRP